MNDTDADRIAKALESIADSLLKLANPLMRVDASSSTEEDVEHLLRGGTVRYVPFTRKTVELPRKP